MPTIVAWISLAIALVTAARILIEIYIGGYRQQMKVMEAGWPVTALSPIHWPGSATVAGDASTARRKPKSTETPNGLRRGGFDRNRS